MSSPSSSHDERPLGAEQRASAAAREQWHFVDYLRLLSKRRWTAIPAFLVIVAGTVAMTSVAIPIFEARAQLLIEAETQNVVTFKEVVEQEMTTVEYYTTQFRILQSRALARTTIERLKLWDHPELIGNLAVASEGGEPEDTSSTMTGLLRSAEQALMSVLGGPREDSGDAPRNSEGRLLDETARQSTAIQGFLERLTITPIRASRLVDVKFRSADPKLAAAIVNALAQAYIDRTLEFKLSASKEATDWLANQLNEQKEKVEESERLVQGYREQHAALSTEESQVGAKLTDLSAMATRARTERLQKELVYQQIVSVAQNDRTALQNFPAVAANVNVQRLRSELSDLLRSQTQLSREFGQKWPQVQSLAVQIQSTEAKLDAELDNAVQVVANEVAAAVAQEQSLQQALNAHKGEALARNRTSIGFEALEREAASNRQIFDTLMQRAKETNISGQLRTNNIRIADEADPPTTPVWPNHRRNLLFALLGGTGFAIALAFGAEYLDNKLKSPEEIRDELGLRCLGLVPKLSARDPQNPMLNNGVPAVFAEAFRTVRTNVLFSYENVTVGSHGRSLVVTSTAPGEGKTVVAANLAAGFAMAGQSVLLIDGDMRRPRVHEMFQRPQDPGLSELVAGNANVRETLQESGIPGLWLLPAGVIPTNPAELLSSPRFRQLLDVMAQKFDWVILDSPPALAVTDASVLAHMVGGVLFVVSADRTSRPAAVKALEQLDAAKANFLGAVLNGVDVRRNAFFYSPYYRREYSNYYSRTA